MVIIYPYNRFKEKEFLIPVKFSSFAYTASYANPIQYAHLDNFKSTWISKYTLVV